MINLTSVFPASPPDLQLNRLTIIRGGKGFCISSDPLGIDITTMAVALHAKRNNFHDWDIVSERLTEHLSVARNRRDTRTLTLIDSAKDLSGAVASLRRHSDALKKTHKGILNAIAGKNYTEDTLAPARLRQMWNLLSGDGSRPSNSQEAYLHDVEYALSAVKYAPAPSFRG